MPSDLMDLRKHIRRLYGMQQLCYINPCLVSLQDRQVYASFHFEQTTRPLREFTDSTKGRANPVWLMVGQDKGVFLALVKQAEANFLACAQSMHAISQTLAHVLHFATGANFLAISVQPPQIDLSTVRVALAKRGQPFAAIVRLVDELENHPDHIYLADVVEHSKCRSIVGTHIDSPSIGPYVPSARPVALTVQEFDHYTSAGHRHHPGRWAVDFLEEEYHRQTRLVGGIMTELIAWAGAQH